MFVIGSWEAGRRKEDKRRGRRTEKNGGRTIKTARRISASWAWKTKTSDRGKNYYLKVNNTKTSVRQFNFGIYFNHCLELMYRIQIIINLVLDISKRSVIYTLKKPEVCKF